MESDETSIILKDENNITPLLELKNIVKKFPGVTALNNVSIKINPGEVHVLLGENGAGKSTLIKTITGVEIPNEGQILWNGNIVSHKNIKEAYQLGIAAIWQELSNIPCLSVTENLFLGNEIPYKGIKNTIDWAEQKKRAKQAFEAVGIDINPNTLMSNLGMGQKQLCEIAKAIERNAKLIIMDEPTSSLSRKEIDHLLKMILQFKSQGIAVLFITHKLDEGKVVGDVVTVLKDGKKVGETQPISQVSEDDIIKMMVGRDLSEKFPKRVQEIGEEIFKVENLYSTKFNNINFTLNKGEILGFFGLVGAGRTEVMHAIFGADQGVVGKMYIDKKPYSPKSEKEAIENGMAFLTENRKEEGLVLIHDVVENATLPALNSFKDGFFINNKKRAKKVIENSNYLNLRPMQPKKLALNFSGGNQQKIVIAKWLNAKSKVIIFDEPTKGVDVGAKVEIYSTMNQLLKEGASIIMVSSEMPEVMGMADRIVTMYEGVQTGILKNDENLSQEKLLIYATGGTLDE